jgi:glucarate dehydratase
MDRINRRAWMVGAAAGGGVLGMCDGVWDGLAIRPAAAQAPPHETEPAADRHLTITNVRVTPIALPDPPILAASGCHGPYFLRNIIEIETDAGITGIGETHGGERNTRELERCREHLVGKSPLAYRQFSQPPLELGGAVYAGIELACLDAIGRATGLRVCELLGGPVRERVEFAAYLFFRFAADHPAALDDPHLVDDRGQGDRALDAWGDVRTPDAMAEMAWKFHEKWGFRVHKLKAGVFEPDMELEALRAISARFEGRHNVRIDPNGRWTVPTALRIGEKLHDLPLEYYEDPVSGQEAMAQVRRETGLVMSTNSCVTRFRHIPDAVKNEPIDVVLGDHHGWGGMTAFQTLGTMTDALGWALSQHSNNHAGVTMAAMIHVGAVVPQLTIASDTHYVWLVEGADIIEGPNLPIEGGHMNVPRGAGLGVTLDRDKLARAHEVYTKCNIRGRDDATTMRRFQPGWQREPF